MNISQYRKPHFLKKEECDPPVTLFITGMEIVNVSRSAKEPEDKVMLHLESNLRQKFRHTLNDTNLNFVADLLGNETDDWIDKELGFKHDPSIEYDGKVVGGIVVIPAEKAKPKRKMTLKRVSPPRANEVEPLPF